MSQVSAVPVPPRTRWQGVYALVFFACMVGSGCSDTLDPGEARRVFHLSAVTYAAQQFVAVGGSFWDADGYIQNSDSTLIATSPDGVTWEAAPSATAGWLHAVTYGGGRFVAVGSHDDGDVGPATSTPVFYTSVDGRAWHAAEAPAAPEGVSPWWRSVAYGANRFVAVGFEDAPPPAPAAAVVATSSDGMTWTAGTVPDLIGSRVTFGNGTFVLWGESGTLGVSTNGVDWNPIPLDSVNVVWNVTFLDGRFVGSAAHWCCFGESAQQFDYFDLSSADGASWTLLRRTAPAEPFFGFTAGAGRFVAHSNYTLYVSMDGLVWERTLRAGNGVSDVTYHDGQFVGVGRKLLTSADGVVWTEREIFP